MKSALRLGFVTARWASRFDGKVWAEAGLGRLVDALADRFAEVRVAAAVSPERMELHDHAFAIPTERFHDLPWLPSVIGGIRKGRECRRVIAEVERASDVVIVQLPFAAVSGLVPPHAPRVYHLCADIVGIVGTSPYYTGLKKVPARAMARAIDLVERALIAVPGTRIVANGAELHRMFGGDARGSAIVSATLLDREVSSVPRTRPADAPFRILFVGYLRHEKGFGTLLGACEELARTVSRPLELAIIGAKHSDDRGVTEDLRRGLEGLKARMTVSLEGFLPFGTSLFQRFADADVLVLPSLSEGTPRVLVEARAFGCPVVASRVGGIPTSVTDGVDGLLVPPGDAPALAAAVKRLIDDPKLAAALREAGVARARGYTIEAMAGVMADEAERAARARS